MRNSLKMERRHFEFIAATVAEIEDDATRDRVALLFLQRCKPTNPNFQADKFREACNARPVGYRTV